MPRSHPMFSQQSTTTLNDICWTFYIAGNIENISVKFYFHSMTNRLLNLSEFPQHRLEILENNFIYTDIHFYNATARQRLRITTRFYNIYNIIRSGNLNKTSALTLDSFLTYCLCV